MISTGNTAPARYDLISLLTKMQAYEVNPRNEDEITALNEIQFDLDEKNYIASIISAVTEPVRFVPRPVQLLEEEEIDPPVRFVPRPVQLLEEEEEEKTDEETIEEFSEKHCLDIDSVTAEWEAVKENYNNEIWKYLNEMARRGDFGAHLA